MRNHHDHRVKEFGTEMLSLAGVTVANEQIWSEVLQADLHHEPDPSRASVRAKFGLLGKMIAEACLIEVYSSAPDAEDFRSCLTKHLAFWQQSVRKLKAANKKRRDDQAQADPSVEPFLWIIAAGTPTKLLTTLALNAAPDWPDGVYFFGDNILRVGIIAARELPSDRSTLLVRLLAGGAVLAPALRQLRSLPADAFERTAAERILLNLQATIQARPNQTPEEEEFIMAMYNSFEEIKAESQAKSVLTVLSVRGVAVSEATRAQILKETDLERLQRWLVNATVATSIEDVFDAPS